MESRQHRRSNRQRQTGHHIGQDGAAQDGKAGRSPLPQEAGLETVLVLTGVSTREMVEKYPYRPTRIVESVAELERE